MTMTSSLAGEVPKRYRSVPQWRLMLPKPPVPNRSTGQGSAWHYPRRPGAGRAGPSSGGTGATRSKCRHRCLDQFLRFEVLGKSLTEIDRSRIGRQLDMDSKMDVPDLANIGLMAVMLCCSLISSPQLFNIKTLYKVDYCEFELREAKIYPQIVPEGRAMGVQTAVAPALASEGRACEKKIPSNSL